MSEILKPFFLVLADKLEPTLAFPIKSVQIIAKNASDNEIENIMEDVKAAMEKRKKAMLYYEKSGWHMACFI